jgi:4-hydroxy-4-methyl-2-oxoglutarate aldolase
MGFYNPIMRMKIYSPEELQRERELMEELKKFDTPTITNAVATYPKNNATCLGLYHPWQGEWYTDQSLKCMYPELGRVVGYAVTCVYGLPDPNYQRRANIADVVQVINESPKPVILAVKQNFPEDIKKINGLLGGNMMTAFQMAGAVGVISDGPSRDVDEIRPFGIQYMLTGVTPGHGDFALQSTNVPVNICGMAVQTGDIIHMDENGAVKFPREYLAQVVEYATAIIEKETKMQEALRRTGGDLELIKKVFAGIYEFETPKK